MRDSAPPPSEKFWLHVPMEQMSREQWESLCDGCAQCCCFKLEDQDTGEVVSTDIACRLLDVESCRCTDYAQRFEKVPGCVQLTPQKVPQLEWLPETCGYRRVASGRDLPEWHPLRSQDPEAVHREGVSVRGQVYSANDVGDVQEVLAHWYGLEFEDEAFDDGSA